MVACLFGNDIRPVIETQLEKKMATTETAIETLAACVVHILQDIQKRKMIIPSPYFPLMLEKAETLLEVDKREEVALGLARVFVDSLRVPALCVLAALQYPEGFGRTVYDGLIPFSQQKKFPG